MGWDGDFKRIALAWPEVEDYIMERRLNGALGSASGAGYTLVPRVTAIEMNYLASHLHVGANRVGACMYLLRRAHAGLALERRGHSGPTSRSQKTGKG